MFRRDVAGDHLDGSVDHGGIVGKAEKGKKVRNRIERQDELGKGAHEDRLHLEGRGRVGGAIIGRQQFIEEGDAPGDAAQLRPEALVDPRPIPLEFGGIGRLDR